MAKTQQRIVAILAASTIALAACGDDTPTTSDTTVESVSSSSTPQGTGPSDEQFLEVATTYSNLVSASYSASITSATTMKTAIQAFVAAPTDATLKATKDAWLAARDDYGPTEAFRLYDGPIDDPKNGPEGQINAWPMDEAYVDYVEGDQDAGIINDVSGFPEITLEILAAANEAGGESNISTGWHAIEFLLWGQDVSTDGPGNRPVTDYTTSANAKRRASYLTIMGNLLVADLTAVADQWDATTGAYRKEFLSDPRTAVQRLMRGIGALSAGELAGERMAVAFETKDQEDEHSCFSDNTNADVLNNAKGIQMVYLADFPGIDGMSPSELVAIADPALAEELTTQIAKSVQLAEDFPATFETMIAAASGTPENQAFEATIKSIETQGESLARAAKALGLEISITV